MEYQRRDHRFPIIEVLCSVQYNPNHETPPVRQYPRIGDRIQCFQAHVHDDMEILLIDSDSTLHVITEDESFAAHQGDIVVFEPFRMHSGYADFYGPKLNYYVLSFSTNLLSQCTKGHFSTMLAGFYSGKLHLRTHMKAPENIAAQLRRIHSMIPSSNSVSGEARLIAAIHELLGMMFEEMLVDDSLQNDTTDPEFVLKVINYVKEHYVLPISTEDVCQTFNYSKSYFCHKFRDCFKCSFITYLNRFRVNSSIDLLKEHKLSIAEIAAAVGFYDVSYFTRIFKQYIGITPSQFLGA